jgi:hypothetical protein
VHVFGSDGLTTASSPTESWPGPFGHSANDRLGFAVADVGDVDGDGFDDLAVAAWNESKPATFDAAVFANPLDCPGAISGSGALWVHRGGPQGVDPAPAFVVYGYSAGDHIDRVVGADVDGDGLSDLAWGAVGTGDNGGLSLARGRAAAPAGVTVICDAVHTFGVSAGSRLGADLASPGDLDGDGCDELAVGADLDDLGVSNQGSVRVLWGDGPGCSGPGVTTLTTGQAGARLGDAVAAGGLLDDDTTPDLVVGAYATDDAGLFDRGAAWWVSGAWITSLARDPAPGWALPADAATTSHLLPGDQRILGDEAWEEAGRGVGAVADPTRPGRSMMVVGRRFADGGSGGATLWRVEGDALAGAPAAVVGGERGAPWGQLGDLIVARPDQPWLAIGAPLGDAAWRDEGVVYPFSLD